MKKNYEVNEKVSIVLHNNQIVDGIILRKKDSIFPFVETIYCVKYHSLGRNEYIGLVSKNDIYPRQNFLDF